MFPEAARRVKILEDLKKSWKGLFPPMIARYSLPYNLGVNEISIAVNNKNTEEMLKNSRGNILRILKKKFDYEPVGNFELKITHGNPFKIIKDEPRKEILPEVEISDDELNAAMEGAPETLPDEINRALSHLMIFLEKRFHKNKQELGSRK